MPLIMKEHQNTKCQVNVLDGISQDISHDMCFLEVSMSKASLTCAGCVVDWPSCRISQETFTSHVSQGAPTELRLNCQWF